MTPIVAIIGRPNVGKSTFFNAVARKNIAIIHDLPGVTRDRNYHDITLDEHFFTLVDTGGFDPVLDEDLSDLVQEQAQVAVDEADVIIFLLDGRQGLLPGDIEIGKILHRTDSPVLFVVNKVENAELEVNMAEFYRLGAQSLYGISAQNRSGISDVMDVVCSHIPKQPPKDFSEDETVVSIVGRPNVGKSSFVNKLLGAERVMVSDVAGTTRDPIDSLVRYNNRTLRFIDTAGIRRKSRIDYSLEKYSVFQALKSVGRSQVSILVLDATQGVTAQDAKIAAEIHDRNRACIIIANKWDLIAKENKTNEAFVRQVADSLTFMDFAPIVTVSALTGQRVRRILDLIEKIGETYQRRVATSVVNREIKSICESRTPPRGQGKIVKIYYASQVKTAPPIFKIYTNKPDAFPAHYMRYMERALRERLGFENVPLCLQIAKRTGKKGEQA
ncbi:MAG: ribosome biogenesis GTPase Der [bacterium]|nr:ribosome biogenesis GTPase Der [bacterium]